MISPYVDKLDSWSSHGVIFRWLQNYPPFTRVLDVGTALGTIGKVCEENNFHIVGIEPNKVYAIKAEPYYTSLINCSLDEAPIEILSTFQVIILADVLEHMLDPQKSLSRLVSLNDKDTVFMISVPNIANIWVRVSLMVRRFEYQDRGILDKTHLRFFTKLTSVRMISNIGLRIGQLVATPIPLNLIHPTFDQTKIGRLVHFLLAKLPQVFPTLLGYQFVVLESRG